MTTKVMQRRLLRLVLLALPALLTACGPTAEKCTVKIDEFQSDGKTVAETSSYWLYPAAGAAYVGDRLAQSFKVSANTTVSKLSLKLKRLGTLGAGSTVQLYIQTNSGGSPSGTEVLSNSYGETSATALSTESTWVEFSFQSTITLAANTLYWVVAKGNFLQSSTNTIVWMGNTSNAYGDGQSKVDIGGVCSGTACWALPADGPALDSQMKFGCN